MYQRGSVGQLSELRELAQEVDRELEKIQLGIEEASRLPVAYREPEKPRDGQIVEADGSSWDPGGGAGTYVYRSGSWVKLQSGDFQPHDTFLDDIAALSDPGANRLLGWDDTSNQIDWYSVGAPLTLSGGVLDVSSATTDAEGVVEAATDAEVRASTSDRYLHSGHLASAAAPVTLTYAASFAWSWADFINGVMTLTGNLEIGNPTNEQPGVYRSITVKGDSSTPRSVTFGTEFGGEDPGIVDVTSTKWYKIVIWCEAAGHFVASAQDVSPP
jgi:hypothetical protein